MDSDKKKEVSAWVTKTFKEHDYETINIEFPDYDTRGGSLGDILFVDVTIRNENGEQCFNLLIKQSKSDNIVLDDMNLRVAYKNEINFYSKIVPFFKKFAEHRNATAFENLPECFGNIVEENLYVILMENLRPKGFKMHELDKPQDMACARLVLEAYAKWQALCLAVKDQEPEIFWNFARSNEDFQKKKLIKLCHATIKKELDFVIGLYEEKGRMELVNKIRDFKENFEKNYFQSMSIENSHFPVIRHGDCWNNNFLFTYNVGASDPERVVIIDWQNSSLGPPLADITQYLLSSCSEDVYEHVEDLLKFYHDILSAKLRELGSDSEKCFSWKDCYDDFKKCLPPAVYNKPIFLRASLATGFNTNFDISQSPDDGDFHGMFLDGLRDPDEYFKRIDDTLNIFIKKGFL